jgi:hypothetical protein
MSYDAKPEAEKITLVPAESSAELRGKPARPRDSRGRIRYADMTPEEKARENARTTVYRKAHPEQAHAIAKKSRTKNRDYFKAYYLENKDRYRERHRKNAYGLAPEAFAVLFETQNGRCAICKTELKLDRTTDVDHDHVSGRVRGLLCHRCNMCLAMAGESSDLLLAAATYLKGRA